MTSKYQCRTMILAALCLAACVLYGALYQANARTGRMAGVPHDFYPLWSAARAVLHGGDPYSEAATRENQLAMYGATAAEAGEGNPQRFVFPLFAVFPVLPVAWLSFHGAQSLVAALLLAMAALSVGWIRGRWDGTTAIGTVLFLASYPVLFAVQSRQPTLLYFGLAAAAFATLRSGRCILAGFFAAIALGKPQVALPIVLAMVAYSLGQRRPRFPVALAASGAALCGLSFLALPRWLPEWMAALRAYSGYIRPSLATEWLGPSAGRAASVVLICGLLAALWRLRNDMLAQASISVLVFQLVLPFQAYNTAALLLPAVWVLDRAAAGDLAIAGVRVALAALWLGNLLGIALWLSPYKLAAALLPGITAKVLYVALVAAAACRYCIHICGVTPVPPAEHCGSAAPIDA